MNLVFLATIGCLVVHRTLRILGEHQMIRQLNHRHELLLQINFVLLCSVLGPSMPEITLLVIAIAIVSPICLSIFVSRLNELRFHNETVTLYDSLLMDVRGGVSVREAILISGQCKRWSYPHRETVAYVVNNSQEGFPNRHKAMQVRAREISSILNSGSKVADRLKFYRDQWALSHRLQRKVRMAAQQTNLQALVVCLMYFAVAIYQILQDSMFLRSKWFLVGSTLLVIGVFFIWRIQRSFRWKL